MKSLQLEEEIAKEQVIFANEEIARLEKIIEAKKSKSNLLKQVLVELTASLESVKGRC